MTTTSPLIWALLVVEITKGENMSNSELVRVEIMVPLNRITIEESKVFLADPNYREERDEALIDEISVQGLEFDIVDIDGDNDALKAKAVEEFKEGE